MIDMNSLAYMGGVGIIVALVQIVKLWIADGKWYPLFAIAFGIVINILVGQQTGIAVSTSVVSGIGAGLAASGVYSANTVLLSGQKQKQEQEPIEPLKQIAPPADPPALN